MLRKYAAAALAATMLPALGGCGGDPQPKFGPPETSPTSPTSPSTTVTAKPASAHELIRRYVHVALAAENRGDTSDLRSEFGECKGCMSIADRIDRVYDEGGYIKAGEWRIRKLDLAGRVGSRYEFNMAIVAAPTEFKVNGKVTHLNGGANIFRLILHKSSTGWKLTDIQDMT